MRISDWSSDVCSSDLREEKPAVVVECGSGLSTVVIARCLQLNGGGQVFSLEHMEKFAAQTRKELSRRGLSDWARVIDAPLERLESLGREVRWYRADRKSTRLNSSH